jgi:hypothetical protein
MVMVVMAVVVVIIMAVVVVIAVVFAVPVAFMNLPALLVVVVVRMGPVGARVGRLLPTTRDPYVASPAISPIAVDPRVAFCGHGRSYLIADGRRRRADIDLNLAKCRCC